MASTTCPSDFEYKELLVELNTLRRKLEKKTEALLLVSEEYARGQRERDEANLQLETTQQRCHSLEAALQRQDRERRRSLSANEEHIEKLLLLVKSLKSENTQLAKERDNLLVKLAEAEGDIKILRQQSALERLKQEEQHEAELGGDAKDCCFSDGSSENVATRKWSIAGPEDSLLSQLEVLEERYCLLEQDLKSVLCEKEELVIERDAYRVKVDRLHQELSYILSGDEKRILDVDDVLMENRYLKEQLTHAHEENGLAKQAINKYKSLLDKRKRANKSAMVPSTSNIVTPKQVQELLKQPQGDEDYRTLAAALLDTLNDKNLALSHQRKANKILGTRLTELETKLKTTEVRSPVGTPTDMNLNDPSLLPSFSVAGHHKLTLPQPSITAPNETAAQPAHPGGCNPPETLEESETVQLSVASEDLGESSDISGRSRSCTESSEP